MGFLDTVKSAFVTKKKKVKKERKASIERFKKRTATRIGEAAGDPLGIAGRATLSIAKFSGSALKAGGKAFVKESKRRSKTSGHGRSADPFASLGVPKRMKKRRKKKRRQQDIVMGGGHRNRANLFDI